MVVTRTAQPRSFVGETVSRGEMLINSVHEIQTFREILKQDETRRSRRQEVQMLRALAMRKWVKCGSQRTRTHAATWS